MKPFTPEWNAQQKQFADSVKPGDVLVLKQEDFEYRSHRNGIVSHYDDRRIRVTHIQTDNQVMVIYMSDESQENRRVGLSVWWSEIED